MIDDLKRRVAYWNRHDSRAPHAEHDLTDSLPYPFEPVESLFDGKDVLEIGPGRGRQYDRLKSKVKSYSICDISQACLSEPVFAEIKSRFLLTDYGTDYDRRFDVVHFWYVLHHVKASELSEFLAFVSRHLRIGGIALFNSPQVGNIASWYKDDGIGTTKCGVGGVIGVGSKHLDFFLASEVNERSTGYLFGAYKRVQA